LKLKRVSSKKEKQMEYENKNIGTEPERLEAEEVEVVSFESEDVKDKEGREVGKKLVLTVKHSKNPEMKISKVKYEKNKSLTESGLWLKEDAEGNLPYFSAIASLLRFYKCDSISALKGKNVNTVADANGFLEIKAY